MTDNLVLYVVHPEQRGVQAHSVPLFRAGPLLKHAVPQPVTLTISELECATVEVCRVESGRVCPHGWFCTTDLRTAQFVDELRGERAAVVAYLREQAGQWDRDAAGWAAMNHASVMIERGLHRREEGA
jgi:hypothetical protein